MEGNEEGYVLVGKWGDRGSAEEDEQKRGGLRCGGVCVCLVPALVCGQLVRRLALGLGSG